MGNTSDTVESGKTDKEVLNKIFSRIRFLETPKLRDIVNETICKAIPGTMHAAVTWHTLGLGIAMYIFNHYFLVYSKDTESIRKGVKKMFLLHSSPRAYCTSARNKLTIRPFNKFSNAVSYMQIDAAFRKYKAWNKRHSQGYTEFFVKKHKSISKIFSRLPSKHLDLTFSLCN